MPDKCLFIMDIYSLSCCQINIYIVKIKIHLGICTNDCPTGPLNSVGVLCTQETKHVQFIDVDLFPSLFSLDRETQAHIISLDSDR